MIYSFRGSYHGSPDGEIPSGNLLPDANGVLYGVTESGGDPKDQSGGTVFALYDTGNGTWSDTLLYSFKGSPDGAEPAGSLVADARGDLFGVTEGGGIQNPNTGSGNGTVFELTPSARGYTERVIYAFKGKEDGADPAGLLLDAAGDLYGTTWDGGTGCTTDAQVPGCGTAFELVPTGRGFAERTIYAFKGLESTDGAHPVGPLVPDGYGNFYGATSEGGTSVPSLGPYGNAGLGTVFELSPSGSTYVERVLHRFTGPDGMSPGTPLLSHSGTLIGTTEFGGPYCSDGLSFGCGLVYEIVP